MSETNTQTEQTAAAGHGVPEITRRARLVVPVSLGLVLVVMAVLVIVLGVVPRMQARASLVQRTGDRLAEKPRVSTVVAAAAGADQKIELPARLQAVVSAAIYAREGGYVKEIRADIGDRVRAGQVLAIIDTPVLDQQIRSASANVATSRAKVVQAEAQAKSSELTIRRLRSVDAGVVSQQSIDDAQGRADVDAAALAAAKTSLEAEQANMQRLREQKELATIVAPFAGEIGERGFDVGDLVIADKTDSNKPVFRVVDRAQMRVFIDLPQSAAVRVVPGHKIRLTVRELPGKVFEGEIVRIASAMDTSTRTRLAEARVENPANELLPGMFAEVQLTIPGEARGVLVPSEALLIRDGKAQLAVVKDGKLEYRPVTIGRDSGAKIEILEGVAPGEEVVVNMAKQAAAGAEVERVAREGK
ncbi:MAG: efflux RND transporter periplasmic adaptor subunit [Phycisphaerales bacterium]|nr:efflux RND transporter periplasmic adaptor subunit [Planctomycetota bacterium]